MPRESDNYLKYSKQFKQDYTASTADIIDNSKLLFLAREDLTDKSWKALQHKVKLSERVTQMLTKIGSVGTTKIPMSFLTEHSQRLKTTMRWSH